jgi:hypothetical protein
VVPVGVVPATSAGSYTRSFASTPDNGKTFNPILNSDQRRWRREDANYIAKLTYPSTRTTASPVQ